MATAQEAALTTTQNPVVTVQGSCGKTVEVNVLGTVIAVQCLHDGGGAQSAPEDPPPPTASTGLDNPDLSQPIDWIRLLDPGSGGGTAMVVDAIENLSREEESDDHLIVITPEGKASSLPADYRRLLNRYANSTRTQRFSLGINDQTRALLSRNVEETAQPYIVVCSPEAADVQGENLQLLLRAAADAQAPIHFLSL